jgi:hypothetical protein
MGQSCCNAVYVVTVKDIRPDVYGDSTVVYLFKDKQKAIAHIRDVEIAEIFQNYKGDADVEYDDVKMIKGFEQGKAYICGETMFMLQLLPIE